VWGTLEQLLRSQTSKGDRVLRLVRAKVHDTSSSEGSGTSFDAVALGKTETQCLVGIRLPKMGAEILLQALEKQGERSIEC
jgi:hypothetical protein